MLQLFGAALRNIVDFGWSLRYRYLKVTSIGIRHLNFYHIGVSTWLTELDNITIDALLGIGIKPIDL